MKIYPIHTSRTDSEQKSIFIISHFSKFCHDVFQFFLERIQNIYNVRKIYKSILIGRNKQNMYKILLRQMQNTCIHACIHSPLGSKRTLCYCAVHQWTRTWLCSPSLEAPSGMPLLYTCVCYSLCHSWFSMFLIAPLFKVNGGFIAEALPTDSVSNCSF